MSTKRFEVYAPVVIPTLCRYEHFKRCIDSLSKCTGAEFTDVFIGIDYPTKVSHWDGYNKICEYVTHIVGFHELVIVKREKNLGPEENIKALREYVKEHYDRCISSEDDNEFSPNFLEYMNECLTHFKDNPNVIRICGSKMTWGVDFNSMMRGYNKNIFPAKDFNASGWAMWFDKYPVIPYSKESVLKSWKLTYRVFQKGYCYNVNRMLYQLKKESQLPDLCMRLYCVFHDKYCIFPSVSKVKNWGFDGSGLNSNDNLHLIDIQELDSEIGFCMDDIEIKDYPEVCTFVRSMFDEGKKNKLKIMINYVIYRFTGKVVKQLLLD